MPADFLDVGSREISQVVFIRVTIRQSQKAFYVRKVHTLSLCVARGGDRARAARPLKLLQESGTLKNRWQGSEKVLPESDLIARGNGQVDSNSDIGR